jgi:hypothetical protein
VTLGYVTIVTPIKHRETLEHYLRNNVRPLFNPVSISIIECRNSFRFDQIKGLHFCSMVILDEVDKSSCLIFEATFDGPRDEFLHDLLRIAGEGIHAIYEKCEGYPQSGLAVPDLIRDYLVRHDAGAQTFYSGSPGRSVAQIEGEKRIRDEIVDFVGLRRLQSNPPTTFLDLQRELQQSVIRGRPANRWAEQPAVVPWEVAQRTLVARAAVAALLAAAGALGVLIFLLCRLEPADVLKWVLSLMNWLEGIAASFIDRHGFLQAISRTIDELRLPVPLQFFALIGLWLILRLFELIVDLAIEKDNPRNEYFPVRYLVPLSQKVAGDYAENHDI